MRPTDLSAPWQLLATAGPLPPRRMFHSAIYDPARDRMTVFGGFNPPGGRKGDLWQLDLAADPPQWSELFPAGSVPPPRYNHAGIHDAARRRMLTFGGVAGPFNSDANDWWELSLDGSPAWHRVLPVGGALGRRSGVQGTYDSLRDRWILSGGVGGGSSSSVFFFTDVVAIDLATLQITSLPNMPRAPFSLFDHSITYDPRQDRLLVFGGAEALADGVLGLELGDVGAAWRTLGSVTPSPETRVEHADWFDTRRSRLLIVGGGHTANPLSGTNVLWFGRRMRTGFDPDSNAPFNPRSHRPVPVVLYGSDSLDVTELDPSTIRVGEAAVIVRGHGLPPFTVRDADSDGFVDAVVQVDGHDIAGGSAPPVVDVRAATTIGDAVCGVLALVAPGRQVMAAPPAPASTATPEFALSALPGASSRSIVRLRARFAMPGAFELELWSVGGRRLASTRLEGPVDRVVALRPASRLAPGIYWARIAGATPGPALRLVLAGE